MTAARGRDAPTKFDLRREATRRELLRLGVERFPIKGYAATTVEDLVRDSGLTRGAFYFHFSGKEDFFLAVLRHRREARDDWWTVAEDPANATLAEVIGAALHVLAMRADGGTALWLALIVEFVQSLTVKGDYPAQLAALYPAWLAELRSFVNALDARGMVRRDLSVDELAGIVFSHVEGVELHHRLYGAVPAGVVDSLCRLLAP
ncbi:MAG TPA: TetR/AcrR family transcriptional regulator [Protaetiibacter sp.]|nr:TetR/AcrR family transcriptional regulator [Protaetiibacter sp.]